MFQYGFLRLHMIRYEYTDNYMLRFSIYEIKIIMYLVIPPIMCSYLEMIGYNFLMHYFNICFINFLLYLCLNG